jgi:mRNA interferase MazF
VIQRGEIWWASLPEPARSEPGYRRPVLVIQSDDFNGSRIATVIALVVTSNTRLTQAPGNVFLPQKLSGLPKDSVANVSQDCDNRQELLDGEDRHGATEHR